MLQNSSQTWIDDTHSQFTESLLVDYDITRESTDVDGNGNDWFRRKYDSKSNEVIDTTNGNWTYHSETTTTYHEEITLESDGSSSFLFGLSKPTGGDVTGSVDLDFDGSGTDEWHIKDKTEREWLDTYDDGYGSTKTYKGKSLNKYDLDDVFTSSYNGDPGATLAGDGSVTGSGTSHYEEDYTFDQVSLDESKSSEDESYSDAYSSTWDLREYEHKNNTTDHYEAEFSADSGSGTGSTPTLTASDDGYTDHEMTDNSCHSWNYSDYMGFSDTGGPDCTNNSSTNHEDWPSYVDEMLAMMEMEANMEAAAEEGGEGGPCATCSDTSDEGGSDDEVLPPVTVVPGVFGGTIYLNDAYFRNNRFGTPCIVCHGVTAQGIVGPPNSFRLPGGVGSLEFYLNLRDTVASGATGVGIAIAGASSAFALQSTMTSLLSIVVIEESVAGVVFFQQTLGGLIFEALAASVTTVPYLVGSSVLIGLYAYPEAVIAIGANIVDALDLAPPLLPLGQTIQILKELFNENPE